MQSIWAMLLSTTLSVSPLPLVFETAEPGLRVFWREGDLLVAPPPGDPRSAIRPLAGQAPVVLNSDELPDWHRLGPTCSADPSPPFEFDGQTATAHWKPPWESPKVEIHVGGQVVASAALNRPLRPCSLAVASVDQVPGLELLLLWQVESASEPVSGLTVLRVLPVVTSP